MKPWREVLFLALSICYVQAQYDFGADNSPPASKYKGVGGAVGAHIGIDNPHASGGYSPTLPPSNINYYPPPDIPRPDFRVWSSAQKSNEVVPNAVQAASTQAYATSGSSGASGAGAGAGVSIGKVPPVKFTIRNLGPNPDFLKAYRGKGASVSAKLEGSSATGGKITEESSQIDLAGSGQSGTSASIPNGVINGPSSLGSGATGSSSASGNAAYSKTPEPTDNKVDTTSSGESYKSAESSGSTAPEQKGTDETGGSGNNVENAGGSGSTVESSQGAGASTGTAEGGQSGGAGSVGGPVEVNAAHGSESSEAGEGSHGASGEAGGIPSGGSITEIGSSGESSASSGGSYRPQSGGSSAGSTGTASGSYGSHGASAGSGSSGGSFESTEGGSAEGGSGSHSASSGGAVSTSQTGGGGSSGSATGGSSSYGSSGSGSSGTGGGNGHQGTGSSVGSGGSGSGTYGSSGGSSAGGSASYGSSGGNSAGSAGAGAASSSSGTSGGSHGAQTGVSYGSQGGNSVGGAATGGSGEGGGSYESQGSGGASNSGSAESGESGTDGSAGASAEHGSTGEQVEIEVPTARSLVHLMGYKELVLLVAAALIVKALLVVAMGRTVPALPQLGEAARMAVPAVAHRLPVVPMQNKLVVLLEQPLVVVHRTQWVHLEVGYHLQRQEIRATPMVAPVLPGEVLSLVLPPVARPPEQEELGRHPQWVQDRAVLMVVPEHRLGVAHRQLEVPLEHNLDPRAVPQALVLIALEEDLRAVALGHKQPRRRRAAQMHRVVLVEVRPLEPAHLQRVVHTEHKLVVGLLEVLLRPEVPMDLALDLVVLMVEAHLPEVHHLEVYPLAALDLPVLQ
ncbi:hypothetical protein QR680_003247 [Steinernema hermaphroditum]|uniref:DUF4766 domain-containing protein n=1 Tax=Steinernema hermaphroditum TaxID=289476 RepID=A0AA39H7T9_9BILA|nr:hypothetical protein QR680_003247 [Steinernema hermaphroditum]